MAAKVSEVLEHYSLQVEIDELRNQARARNISDDLKAQLQLKIGQLKSTLKGCLNIQFEGDQKEIEAALALREELKKQTETLDRDMDVFHWFDPILPYAGFDGEISEKNLSNRLRTINLQNNFHSFDVRGGTGYQGRGLYAASNITTTRNFGSNSLPLEFLGALAISI